MTLLEVVLDFLAAAVTREGFSLRLLLLFAGWRFDLEAAAADFNRLLPAPMGEFVEAAVDCWLFIGEDNVLVAGFLLVGLTFLMGVVAEGWTFFLALEEGVTLTLEVGVALFDAVGLPPWLPGGDLLPAVLVVEDRLDDPVGDVLPDEGGVGLLLGLADFDVTDATDVFFGGWGGGDSGGKLRGGGGGGGDPDEAGGGDVKLLGPEGCCELLFPFPPPLLLSNWDLRALKFLVESVLVATCLPLEVVPPTDEDGEAAEAVVGDFDSKIEIRSLIPFFMAGELILVCLIK